MDAAAFYRDVEEQFCQGDIFDAAPHAFLKERPKGPHPISLASRKAGHLVDALSGESLPEAGAEVPVPAPTLVERAILLSHGWEIDKDKKHRIIALVRPMASLTKEEERETIRKNGRRACFYLPAHGDRLPEGYIDFRRISPVCPEWLEKRRRLKTLSEDARRQMLLALFLYFARVQLHKEIFETGETHEGGAG
jgi:hypothetical protein